MCSCVVSEARLFFCTGTAVQPHDSQNLNSLSFGADRERRLERDRELHLAAAAARAEIAREDAAVMRLQDAARQSARARSEMEGSICTRCACTE